MDPPDVEPCEVVVEDEFPLEDDVVAYAQVAHCPMNDD